MIKTITSISLAATLFASAAFAGSHAMAPMAVMGEDQDVSAGTVTATKIMAEKNGWMVVHRTDDTMKPGPVVGYAPLKMGENQDVTAILTQPIPKGEKLMLMLHGEAGGMKTGVFEYTLGAKEDGPVKVDGQLVMIVVNTL